MSTIPTRSPRGVFRFARLCACTLSVFYADAVPFIRRELRREFRKGIFK